MVQSSKAILIVDEDSTAARLVSAVVKRLFPYQVFTTESPLHALSIIRERCDIELVVSDLHSSEMNGLELQKVVAEEFNLPVILMSADYRETVVSGLESAVPLYIRKPVNFDSFSKVHEIAIALRKGKTAMMAKEMKEKTAMMAKEMKEKTAMMAKEMKEKTAMMIKETDHVATLPERIPQHQDVGPSSLSMSKEKGTRDEDEDEDKNEGNDKNVSMSENEDDPTKDASPRKTGRFVWTPDLQLLFEQAINELTLEGAAPKKIVDFMNIPGLTRKHVASHLQKYRMYAKRAADQEELRLKALQETLQSAFSNGRNSSTAEMNATQNQGGFTRNPLNEAFYNQEFSAGFHGFGDNPSSSLINVNNYSVGNESGPSDQFHLGRSNLPHNSVADSRFDFMSAEMNASVLFYPQQPQTRPHFDHNNGGLSQFALPQPWTPDYHINLVNPTTWNDNSSFCNGNRTGSNYMNLNSTGTLNGDSGALVHDYRTGNTMINDGASVINERRYSNLNADTNFRAPSIDANPGEEAMLPLPQQPMFYGIANGGGGGGDHQIVNAQQLRQPYLTPVVPERNVVQLPYQAQGGGVVPNPNFSRTFPSTHVAVGPSTTIPRFSTTANGVGTSPQETGQLQRIEGIWNQDDEEHGDSFSIGSNFGHNPNPLRQQATRSMERIMAELRALTYSD